MQDELQGRRIEIIMVGNKRKRSPLLAELTNCDTQSRGEHM